MLNETRVFNLTENFVAGHMIKLGYKPVPFEKDNPKDPYIAVQKGGKIFLIHIIASSSHNPEVVKLSTEEQNKTHGLAAFLKASPMMAIVKLTVSGRPFGEPIICDI